MSHINQDAGETHARQNRPPELDVLKHALFLDLDGTLVDLEKRPDQVASDQTLRVLLQDLGARLNGALAIVSGRSIADIDRILHDVVPCVSGLHGQEQRIGLNIVSPPASDKLRAAAAMARTIIASGNAYILLEDKGAGFALHYRSAPEHEDLVRRAADEIAARHGLKVIHGKMVAELVPKGASKALAVTALMRDAPFAGRMPIAIGDDVTDEDAFAATATLGGFSILVGAPRPTLAQYRLPGVQAVKSWLLAGLGRSAS